MRRRRDEPGPDETRFAAFAPTFEAFPGFEARDLDAFQPHKQRDARHNGERLVVKRKLAALGQALSPALKAAGLDLPVRTSLSHPFRHNAFRVSSQWVYWGRSDAAKKALKKVLGAELGADVDPAYQGVVLLVEVDAQGLACGLKLHPSAWWDGQSLKKRVLRSTEQAEALCALLNALPEGYAMAIGGFRRRYEAGKLRPADVHRFFQTYTPGQQWLELLHGTPRADVLSAGAAIAQPLAERLAALAPVYRFALWSPDNDAVLGR